MDSLSDVLKSVRLDGAVYYNAEFRAPWCINATFGLKSVSDRLGHAEHVMFFHFLVDGGCKMQLLDTGEVLPVTAGELVLFSENANHLMGSDLQLAPIPAETLAADPASDPDFVHVRHGGRGEVTRFVCGYLACSSNAWRRLFAALPRVVRIPIGDGRASALLLELLRVGVRESSAARPGAESVLAKLSELMFVEALRRYAETLPPGGRSWLAGVRDPHVGRALALLHREPDKRWTVDDLARAVALSRSALAERFTALIGEPPIQYLMRWRLGLAAQLLRTSREPVARVAERSGYESEAAFSRAFKREFGVPPASWRRTGSAVS